MNFLRQKYAERPEFPRILPFAIFVVLTSLADAFGGDGRFWMYLAKSVVGAWMLWEVREFAREIRWDFSLEAILVGIAIFGVWVGLDGFYPPLTKIEEKWNPFAQFPDSRGMAWFFISVHILGSSIVVPPIEELFYRSFLYRYFVKIDFLGMPFSRFHPLSFAVTSIIFGLMHPDRWLAGILCGLAYQWLVVRKNRLGDAIVAHAITNFLLGIWIVWKGAWSFW